MKKNKRIAAVAGVILILFLYVLTFILAMMDRPEASKWFTVSAFCTIVIPVMIYVYFWLYQVLKGRNGKQEK